MMASSQVEIARPTSVHSGQHDSYFQDAACNILPTENDLTDLWVHHPQWQAPTNTTSNTCNYDDRRSLDYSPVETEANNQKDKWARAREIVFPVEVSSSGGVSTLVQKWRGFEAEAKSCIKATNDDDSIGDWESDRTTCSGRDSDFTESERLRVADIIRRLKGDRRNGTCSDSPPRVRMSWDHQSPEQRCISPVVGVGGSPRIRGRQAYVDLLKQMVRDRFKELECLVARKPVTEFSHRGRIQALLRIRFLRRSMDGRLSSESHKSKTHFRERANQSGSVYSEKELNDKAFNIHAAIKKDKIEVANSAVEKDIQDTTTTKERDIHHTCVDANKDIESHGHETTLSSIYIGQKSSNSLANSADKTTETNSAKPPKSLHTNGINKHNKEDDEATNHHVTEINCELAGNCVDPHEQESTGNQYIVESDTYWEEQREVSGNDWIGEVSRPRSDWEHLRQARYQEMLDPFLDNQEIRALLGRKSVSTFLSSGMREKIDQLMICRSQGHCIQNNNQSQQGKHEELLVLGQSIISSGVGEREDEEGGGYGDYFHESSMGQHYNESDECMASSPPALWPQTQGHESSICSALQSPSNYYSQDNEPDSSYRAHPAIGMELIYDLRRHMEQLHQEMSELRKSINCCTDMQIKLQRSIKKEVTTSLTNADTKDGRQNPVKKGISGGRCCVGCSKVQVDCVLYRCGHMCTCFQCALELQWSSGKCPTCRAPIMDVVRTYSNY